MDKKTPVENLVPAPTGARPTLKTIAFMTGLGITTVSRALKDAPEIGVETRRRVQLVARQVGYRPNRAGVRLRTGKTNVISLVLNTEEQIGGFVSSLIYGLTDNLAPTPYHLIVTPYARNNDPLEPVRYVVETGSADGIIISRIEPDDPRVRYLAESGLPFATHGRTQMGIEHPFHDFDNHAYALAAVGKLAARGRRRLALLAPPPSLTFHHHMRNGFIEGVEAHGLSEVPFGAANIDQKIGEIRAQTAALMRRDNPPDGFVVGSGAATFAAVAGIEDAGFRLGRDVDVAAKESAGLLHLFRPQLLVFHEDVKRAGSELARAVLGAIDGAPAATLQSLGQPVFVPDPT